MANEYTTISVDMSLVNNTTESGTLRVKWFGPIVLANGDTIAANPRGKDFTLTSGVASISLAATDAALVGTGLPYIVEYIGVADTTPRTLGPIYVTTTAGITVTLASLLAAAGTPTALNTQRIGSVTGWLSTLTTLDMTLLSNVNNLDRCFVKGQGIYRAEVPPVTPAVGLLSMTSQDALTRWVLETDGSETYRFPFFNAKQYGATGDGSTDDYAALVKFRDAVQAAGKGTAYFPPGTYYIGRTRPSSDNITWTGLDGVTFVGNGAKIDIKGDFNRDGTASELNPISPFTMVSCNNLVIQGLEIDGNVDQMTHGVGVGEGSNYPISLSACNNVRLVDLYLHHSCTDNLYITGATLACRNVTVDHCRFIAAARNCVSVIQAFGATFTSCELSAAGQTNAAGTAVGSYTGHSPQAGLDVEPTRNVAAGTIDVDTADVRFYGCRFSGSKTQQIVSGVRWVKGLLFDGCSIDGTGGTYTAQFSCGEARLRGCNINTGATAILPNTSEHAYETLTIIENCTIYGSGAGVQSTSISNTVKQRVILRGNRFVGTHTSKATTYFPYIQNRHAEVIDNTFFIPKEASDGNTVDTQSLLQNCREVRGNRWYTDLAGTAVWFCVSYTNAAEVFDENHYDDRGYAAAAAWATGSSYLGGLYRTNGGLTYVAYEGWSGTSTWAGASTYTVGTYIKVAVGSQSYVYRVTTSGGGAANSGGAVAPTHTVGSNSVDAAGYIYEFTCVAALPVSDTITGTTTNGSPTVTGVSAADIAKLVANRGITGAGISSGTYISAIGASSFTLSANATASGTVTITINTVVNAPTHHPGLSGADGYGKVYADGYSWWFVTGGNRFSNGTSNPYTISQTVQDPTVANFGQGGQTMESLVLKRIGSTGTHIRFSPSNGTPITGIWTKGSWYFNDTPAANDAPYGVATTGGQAIDTASTTDGGVWTGANTYAVGAILGNGAATPRVYMVLKSGGGAANTGGATAPTHTSGVNTVDLAGYQYLYLGPQAVFTPAWLTGSATWNPPNLASGASQTTTVTVTGAALGDHAIVSFSLDQAGTQMTGYVSAANTVTAVHSNLTGGAVDLASGTVRARVFKVQ